MLDETFRPLERRFNETGAEEDFLALERQAIRQGRVSDLAEIYAAYARDCNPVLLRETDRDFFSDVIAYVRGFGATPEIRGSVLWNAQEGRRMEYNDIDVAVFGGHTAKLNLLGGLLMGGENQNEIVADLSSPMLARLIRDHHCHIRYIDGLTSEMHLVDGNLMGVSFSLPSYVGEIIDHRLHIIREQPPCTIDLNIVAVERQLPHYMRWVEDLGVGYPG